MAMNVVLRQGRQSPKGMSLSWSTMEEVKHYLVFVATRALAPEELEAAEALGGTDDCTVFKVGAEVSSVVDDFSPAGEPRFYGVGVVFTDGAVKDARFRPVPDGATAESMPLSLRMKGAARPAAARLAAAPAARPATLQGAPAAPAARPASIQGAPPAPAARPATITGAPAPSVTPAAAARPAAPTAAEEDPLEARKRAQREARARMEAERAAASGGAPSQGAEAPVSAEPPPPPSAVPLEETFDARMSGGTQTWDGLRIYWERAGGPVAAYEILVSDHQVFGDELADALAGKADFTTAVAVAPAISAVIDNITPREARGWYLVLTRAKDGGRAPHPFKVGDAAESGKPLAPFVNPNRTGELRAEVEDLLGQARENWDRWKSEQDRGAQREARRLVSDALLIFPNYPAAKALESEMG